MSSNDILTSLGKVGRLFYERMSAKLTGEDPYPPGSDNERGFLPIEKATTVGEPKQDGNTYMVEIRIDLSRAPYAGAYEEGSGVHGPLRSTYPIKPKNAFALIFPKEDWPDWEDWGGRGAVPSPEGIFALMRVDHPGVEAKPYIQPTIIEIHDDVKTILAREFKVRTVRDS